MILADIGTADGIGLDDIFFFSTGALAVGGALAMLFRGPIKQLLRTLNWLEVFRQDWTGEEDRPGVRGYSGVMERLSRLDGEFSNDGDGSLRAAVDRLSKEVSNVSTRAAAMEIRQKKVQDDTSDSLKRAEGERKQIAADLVIERETLIEHRDTLRAALKKGDGDQTFSP